MVTRVTFLFTYSTNWECFFSLSFPGSNCFRSQSLVLGNIIIIFITTIILKPSSISSSPPSSSSSSYHTQSSFLLRYLPLKVAVSLFFLNNCIITWAAIIIIIIIMVIIVIIIITVITTTIPVLYVNHPFGVSVPKVGAVRWAIVNHGLVYGVSGLVRKNARWQAWYAFGYLDNRKNHRLVKATFLCACFAQYNPCLLCKSSKLICQEQSRLCCFQTVAENVLP